MELNTNELRILLVLLEREKNAYGLNEEETKVEEKLLDEYKKQGGFINEG